MSTDLRTALRELRDDVDTLRLTPAASIRARGEQRRRRQAMGAGLVVTVAVGAAVAGIAYGPAAFDRSRPANPGGGPSPTGPVCPYPAASIVRGEIVVFLKVDATEAERNAVQERLESLPFVATIRFESRQAAYQRFKQIYCAAPDLVAATKPEALPEAFHIMLTDPASYRQLEDAMTNLPGVDTTIRQ